MRKSRRKRRKSRKIKGAGNAMRTRNNTTDCVRHSAKTSAECSVQKLCTAGNGNGLKKMLAKPLCKAAGCRMPNNVCVPLVAAPKLKNKKQVAQSHLPIANPVPLAAAPKLFNNIPETVPAQEMLIPTRVNNIMLSQASPTRGAAMFNSDRFAPQMETKLKTAEARLAPTIFPTLKPKRYSLHRQKTIKEALEKAEAEARATPRMESVGTTRKWLPGNLNRDLHRDRTEEGGGKRRKKKFRKGSKRRKTRKRGNKRKTGRKSRGKRTKRHRKSKKRRTRVKRNK